MSNKKEMEKKLGCNNKQLVGKVREKEIQKDVLISKGVKDKLGGFSPYLVKRSEKGKTIIVLVIKWMLITFISGLFEHWCEPIYKVLTPSFFSKEEYTDTENSIEISVNTLIQTWNVLIDVNTDKESVMIEYCRTKIEDRTYGQRMKGDKNAECGCGKSSKSNSEMNFRLSVSKKNIKKAEKTKNQYIYHRQKKLKKHFINRKR